MLRWGWLGFAVALVLLLLAAAKAHGRQVRLERERVGVQSVDFGRDNGPIVEAIWRRDRITFWSAFAVLAIAGVVAIVLRALELGPVAAGIPAVLALAFVLSFVVSGLAAFAPLVRGRPGDDPVWRAQAVRGSLGWWTLVAAALVLVALSL